MNSDLTNTSLESLAFDAKNGSVDAERAIISSMKADVHRLATNTFSEGQETEDLEQEGLIGLLEAIRDYDPLKNDSFRPFALLCIKRQIQSAQEKMLRKKNQPLNRYVSLGVGDEEEWTDLSLALSVDTENPEKLILDGMAEDELFHQIEDVLSPFERQVLFLRLQGYSIKAQAEILERSEKSIENAIHRIRLKGKDIKTHDLS